MMTGVMKKMPMVVISTVVVVAVVVVVMTITTIFGEIVMMVIASPGCYQCDGWFLSHPSEPLANLRHP